MGKSDESKAEYLLFFFTRGNRADPDVRRQEEHAAWGHVRQDRSAPFYTRFCNHHLNRVQ